MTAIASIRRWQWIVIGILVGLVLRTVRDRNGANLGQFGDAINDPLRFERALLTAVAGRPAFTDGRVHRQVIRDGAGGESTAVHVVSGKYCNGEVDPRDGGYHWRAAVFIAPIPYKPASYLPDLLSDEAIARYEAVERPTVVTLLEALAAEKGVRYRHAWWDSYPTTTWFGGSIAIIGLVWPTVINVLVYGRFVRPREEKRPALRRAAGRLAGQGAPKVTTEDLEQLERLEAELEAGLGEGAPRAAAPARRGVAKTVKLDATPLSPAVDLDGDEKTFGAKPDDFYPTEQRGVPPRNGRAGRE